MFYFYILIEFEEIGYLLSKSYSLNQDEMKENYYYFSDYFSEQKRLDVPNEIFMNEISPILNYPIFPKDSMIFGNFTVIFFPLLDFTLYFLKSELEINDFSKINRIVDEPSVECGVMNIMDDDGNFEELGFGIFLN